MSVRGLRPADGEPLPAVPPPAELACRRCRWGRRFVDLIEIHEEEEGEGWKPPKRRVQEGYYCTHATVKDPADSSVVIVGRLHCALQEQ